MSQFQVPHIIVATAVNLPSGAATEGLLGYAQDTGAFYYYDGAAWSAFPTGGGGVSDGDKGDITISGAGTVYEIDAGVVGNAELRDSGALSVIGRSANSSGDPADISATATSDAVLRESGSTLGFGTVTTGGLADGAVTYVKIQEVSTASRVLGLASAGPDAVSELTATQVLDFVGSTRGSVLYRGASGWAILTPGTSGYVLTSNGSGADPTYQAAGAVSGAPYGQYDPNRPPSAFGTGGWGEEYTGDAETQTWTGRNITGTTKTLELDTAYVAAPAAAGESMQAYTTTIPDGSSGDFTITMQMSPYFQGAVNNAGPFIVATGTAASPTLLYGAALVRDNAPGDYDLVFFSKTSYTSATTTIASNDITDRFGGPFWIQLRYVTSSKALTAAWSTDGSTWWIAPGGVTYTTTLANHPTTSGGYFVNVVSGLRPAAIRVSYYRARTDATGTTEPFPCGE